MVKIKQDLSVVTQRMGMNKQKKGIVLVIVPVYVVLMVWLAILLISRYEYQKGVIAHELAQYDKAIAHLSAAERVLPSGFAGVLAPRDLFRIHAALGKALYQQAMIIANQATVGVSRRRSMESAYQLFKQGYGFLKQAVAHDPLSYRTAFWYAKITAKLALLHSYFNPGVSTVAYDALPLFQRAAALRPSGITVRYEMASYFHQKGMTAELRKMVKNIGTIYPDAYGYLKKQSWFDADIRAMFRQGCMAALANTITPRQTLSILSSIALEEGEVDAAIEYYQRSMKYQIDTNTASTYRHLAGLYLKKGEVDHSFELFLKALGRSGDLKGEFNAIYNQFKAEKQFEAFIRFTRYVEEKYHHSPVEEMILVRSFMDMGQLEMAKAKLERMNAKSPTARAWYLLATIAEKEKDWDAMELASQRATVLSSYNSQYHYYFCVALQRKGKYEQAEAAVSRAIDTTKKKTAGLYNHRAWIRWNLKKYSGAIEDWQRCLKLHPENSGYYFNIAKAYHRQEMDIKALDYAQRARELDPDNKTYQEWILKL